MAVDSTNLYWIDNTGRVLEIDKNALAGTPKILATGQPGPSSIALDSSGILWTNSAGGTVMRLPKSGGEPVVLASNQPSASRLVVDDLGAVWLRDGREIVAMPRQ